MVENAVARTVSQPPESHPCHPATRAERRASSSLSLIHICPTSHTSIIARQLGIPCVVAAAALRDIPDATPILIDGTRGTLEAGVPVAEAEAKVTADAARREAIRTWRGPAQPLSLLHL